MPATKRDPLPRWLALGVAALALDVAWALLRRAHPVDLPALLPSIAGVMLPVLAFAIQSKPGRRETMAYAACAGLALLGVTALPLARRVYLSDALSERSAELAELVEDPWLSPLEEQHGFGEESHALPEVSPREEPSAGTWCAHERHRDVEARPLGELPGLVVRREGGALVLDPLVLALPAALRALDRDGARWIAFLRRVPATSIARGLGRARPLAQGDRVDLRLVDLATGDLVAHLSCGAVGTSEPDAEAIVGTLAEVLREGAAAPPAPIPVPWPASECPAMPERVATSLSFDRACAHGATPACLRGCEEGRASACAVIGLAAEQRDPAAAGGWLQRGCRAGWLEGCTGLAEWLAREHHGDDAAARCAASLHERACELGDARACAAFGLALLRGDGVTRDRAGARDHLVRACDEHGREACATLGTLRARGEIDGTLEEADAALRRACETGHRASCGRRAADFVRGAAGI